MNVLLLKISSLIFISHAMKMSSCWLLFNIASGKWPGKGLYTKLALFWRSWLHSSVMASYADVCSGARRSAAPSTTLASAHLIYSALLLCLGGATCLQSKHYTGRCRFAPKSLPRATKVYWSMRLVAGGGKSSLLGWILP